MISVIIPTCHRPEMFRAMLKSLVATTQGYEIEVVAVIDDDMESVKIAGLYGATIDYSPTHRGAIYCWNKGLSLSEGRVICPSGDDQLFYPNWLDYALESHKERLDGYGVVGMNDLAYDGNLQLATMFIFDRQFCKDHLGGVIAPPCYHYYNVDSEINAKAKALGKYYWDKRSIVEHLHSAHGKRAVDQHDQNRQDNDYMALDSDIFEQRMIQGFPTTWEPVI